MRYYGSAMRFPHIQGAFKPVSGGQILAMRKAAGRELRPHQATFAEPFSVALHATKQAGESDRKTCSGDGVCVPIGALVVAATKMHGALEVVVTGRRGRGPGASPRWSVPTETINVASDGARLAAYAEGKGTFDVVVEASANEVGPAFGARRHSPAWAPRAVGTGRRRDHSTEPARLQRDRVVRIVPVPRGVRMGGPIDRRRSGAVGAVCSPAYFPIEDAVTAFEAAGDRSASMKVLLSFD